MKRPVIKSDIDDVVDQLTTIARHFISCKSHHISLEMSKEDMVQEMVLYSLSNLDGYDEKKSGSFYGYFARCFRHYLSKKYVYKNANKRAGTVVPLVSESVGGEEDDYDVSDTIQYTSWIHSHSDNKYTNREFLNGLCFWWLLNAHDHFSVKSTRYKTVIKIYQTIKDREEIPHYGRYITHTLKTNRQSFEQIMQIMRPINRKIWNNYLISGKIDT